jgi:hypothetical protein
VAEILKKGSLSGNGSTRGQTGSSSSCYSTTTSSATLTSSGNEISPKDVFDILKFSFLLQVSYLEFLQILDAKILIYFRDISVLSLNDLNFDND